MSELDVIVLPRDPNPYQELLYEPMRRRGARVRYAGALTGSHTLNLLTLPVEIALLRVAGFRVLHIHWVFGFHSTVWGEHRGVRRACRAWFTLVRRLAQRCGMTLVWTAHNVLPHAPVFDDDLAARRGLVQDADLVIAHSRRTLEALGELGLVPRHACVIEQGLTAPAAITTIPQRVGSDGPVRLLCFGRIEPYKGVDDAVRTARELSSPFVLRVAGECVDPALRARIVAAAGDDPRIELRLRHLPEDDLVAQIAWADVLLFPFRAITTSASLLFGMAAGRPALIPNLPAMDEVPEAAVFRYSAGGGLRDGLEAVLQASDRERRIRGGCARAYATTSDWDSIAKRTQTAYAHAQSLSRG